MTGLVFRYIETIRILIQFLIQITFKIHILYINILKYVYSVREYFKIHMFYSESYVGKFFSYSRQSVS